MITAKPTQREPRPRILMLCCGAGGDAMGYYRAGFAPIGVDIRPSRNYPFQCLEMDALAALTELVERGAIGEIQFDAVHASPPCKDHNRFAVLWKARGYTYDSLIAPIRELLMQQPRPWVIENTPGAPMRADVVLCGSMFGLGVDRDRWFELSWPHFELMPPHVHDGNAVCVVGHGGGSGSGTKVKRWRKAEGSVAMGIDWMTRDELTQAIPPAYTEWIGLRLLEQLRTRVTP